MDWPLVGREQLLDTILEALRGSPGSVVLEGALGVGKTRLVREAAERLRTEGWRIELCAASPAGAAIPFGALSHLVPLIPSGDPLLTLERARREFIAAGAGGRLLLVIDDAHQLDPGSMTLVHRLAVEGDAAVLLTCRTDDPIDDTIVSLWKDGHAERIAVPPLDRAGHDTLVGVALGGEPTQDLADRLWRSTEGYPLFLRELVWALVERDQADTTAGSVIDAALAPSPRLVEIIGARLQVLSPAAREALEAVALAEPIRLDLLRRIHGRQALADLDARQVVSVARIGELEHVRTTHPAYGDTIRAELPTLRRAAHAAALAEALIAEGLPYDGDALRAAGWLLEAGEGVPRDLAVRAAHEAQAKGDPRLAERFARAALAGGEGTDALIALGAALSVQHRPDEARSVLERARSLASNDAERAAAALASARHLVWLERALDEGAALLEHTSLAVSDPAARAELRAEQAIIAAVAGRTHETIDTAAEVLAEPAAEPRIVLSALVQSTLARAVLGRYEGLEGDFDRADALAAEQHEWLPLARDQVGITRTIWLRFQDLQAAAQIAAAGWQRAMSEGGAPGLWSITVCWLEVDRGNLDLALRVAQRGVSEAQVFDPFFTLPMVQSLVALAHGLRGELDACRNSLAAVGPPDAMEARTRCIIDRAAIWASSADPARAAAHARVAGERAEAATMITWGVPLYHDAVRLGHAASVVGPLDRLARSTDAAMIALMSRHAHAAIDGDPGALADVAEEYVARGSPLFAAEALADAALRGDPTAPETPRRAVRSAYLHAQCPGAVTPLLSVSVSPLSPREGQIALLAGHGATSREIADRLSLSTRTVDNHLAAAYHKLHLHHRDELAAIFA